MARDYTRQNASTMTETKISDLTSLIALAPDTILRLKYFGHDIGSSYNDIVNRMIDVIEENGIDIETYEEQQETEIEAQEAEQQQEEEKIVYE